MKKDNIYYLMRDILGALRNNDYSFLVVFRNHLIAKEATINILNDEINEKKPNNKVLRGALLLLNTLLHSRSGIYELMDNLGSIKFCYKKIQMKTIKRLAAEVVLRLFALMYLEYILLPGRKEEGKELIGKFKKIFSQEDMVNIISSIVVFRMIFRNYGIEIGDDSQTVDILKKFYK